MAIYHLEGQVISRSQGRSAVACAAYRSAEKLLDERLDNHFDYSRKEQVEHCEILLPKDAPEWMGNREKLWNAVEQGEKRKDAQLAREIVISLPRELTIEQNILLAREFAQKEFVDRGMVADVCVHTEKAKDGELQPHAHIMLTMREVTPEGFGQKVREWNDKAYLLQWREAWSETANRHLALNGHDMRIDHRSFSEQGIDLEPQRKIGPGVAQEKMAAVEEHIRISRENGEKIFENPEIALDALTRQQSTFTHQDIAKLVNRQTADAEQFQSVYQKVLVSPDLVALGKDEHGRERLTTHTMLAIEKGMVEDATGLFHRQGHAINSSQVDQVAKVKTLSPQQTEVLKYITEEGDLKNIMGYAGTGKSHLLGAAREAWEAQGYRVAGVTLSGIAAENLEASSGIQSRTIASRSYYWNKGEQKLTSRDILVVDEAGMLGSRELARILKEANEGGAKVVHVGDTQQFQAIGAGAAFRAVIERTSFVELTEVRRQHESWQREATVDFANGRVEEAFNRYQQYNHVHKFETQANAKKAMVDTWNDTRIAQPDKTHIMLSYTRKDAHDLNLLGRELRQQLGELGVDHAITTELGIRQIAEGDRIYFLKNDTWLDVKNGSLGTVNRIDGDILRVRLDKEDQGQPRDITVDTKKYNHFDHGYAATMHKGQGVTVDRSYVLSSKYMDAHATYVSMTRHRDSVDFFYSREEFEHKKDLMQTLSRDRSKDVTLDYLDNQKQQQAFAKNYGVEPQLQERQPQPEKEVIKSRSESTKREKNTYQRGADNLQKFKERFEQKNPERAALLRQSVMPESEKRALDAAEKFRALEQKALESQGKWGNRFDRENLEKYAHSLNKESQLMSHIEKHDQALAKQLQELSKSHERSFERGGRSL